MTYDPHRIYAARALLSGRAHMTAVGFVLVSPRSGALWSFVPPLTKVHYM